ncbi:erythromycin esterase family protein [Sediminicoccus sp. BL-A-41-H5]|uniref:erythromycin esterase family protein n=1 Tax=Sediminicoccus sp. BL-A-41-H5 TaxID=3421106 RepID=UPI003D66690B
MAVSEPGSREPAAYGREALCHQVGVERFLFDLRFGRNDAMRKALSTKRLERYIGVIYRPETERWREARCAGTWRSDHER